MSEAEDADTHELTGLLQAWSTGDREALDRLVPRVYQQLHRLAARYMAREKRDHPLQATALINEAYVRLIRGKNVEWQNRAHFFAVASKLMRRILVDMARNRRRSKRGGGMAETVFDEAFVFLPDRSGDVISVDEALKRLAEIDPRRSQIVELRFFGGLNIMETAMVLQLSDRTIRREWNFAKAWLRREINSKMDAAHAQSPA